MWVLLPLTSSWFLPKIICPSDCFSCCYKCHWHIWLSLSFLSFTHTPRSCWLYTAFAVTGDLWECHCSFISLLWARGCFQGVFKVSGVPRLLSPYWFPMNLGSKYSKATQQLNVPPKLGLLFTRRNSKIAMSDLCAFQIYKIRMLGRVQQKILP